MPQTRLHLRGPKQDLEQIYALLDQGLEEEGLPLAIMEISEDEDIWEVSVYADGDADGAEGKMRALLHSLGEIPAISREELPDIDWVSHSLEGLHAVRAGRFFVHGAHDRDEKRFGEIGVHIEAGQAFGTGHHGTTSGCLETIEQVMRRENPRNALDLGTGSAVLAIAMAKLSHIPVLATDIDPIATRVAAENVRLNQVAGRVETVTAPGFHHRIFSQRGPFDLIVANILARPLMGLAPQMARHLASGGSAILSGILDRQRNNVVAAYVNQGFRHVSTIHREGWVTIHLKR